MLDFIAERCTPEKDAEIREELKVPTSYARRFIDAWAEDAGMAFQDIAPAVFLPEPDPQGDISGAP